MRAIVRMLALCGTVGFATATANAATENCDGAAAPVSSECQQTASAALPELEIGLLSDMAPAIGQFKALGQQYERHRARWGALAGLAGKIFFTQRDSYGNPWGQWADGNSQGSNFLMIGWRVEGVAMTRAFFDGRGVPRTIDTITPTAQPGRFAVARQFITDIASGQSRLERYTITVTDNEIHEGKDIRKVTLGTAFGGQEPGVLLHEPSGLGTSEVPDWNYVYSFNRNAVDHDKLLAKIEKQRLKHRKSDQSRSGYLFGLRDLARDFASPMISRDGRVLTGEEARFEAEVLRRTVAAMANQGSDSGSHGAITMEDRPPNPPQDASPPVPEDVVEPMPATRRRRPQSEECRNARVSCE